ncbi:MAG: HEAT repeat domain-containing protein, partial [Chloroflexi bacterium]
MMSTTANGFVSKTERLAYLEQLLSGKLPAGPATEHLLTRLMNPAVRGPFLETLLLQPLPTIRDCVANLAATGDDRAATVLSPLLHSLDEPVVLLTIDALRRLGSPAARPALAERVTYDQRPAIRQAADEALANLPEEAVPTSDVAQLPLYAAYLTAVDGAGGQMALVARQWEENEIALFHVI